MAQEIEVTQLVKEHAIRVPPNVEVMQLVREVAVRVPPTIDVYQLVVEILYYMPDVPPPPPGRPNVHLQVI